MQNANEDVWQAIDRASRVGNAQRPGQAVMNALGEWRMDLYLKVTGTDADPFYDSSRLPAFYTWLTDQLSA